MQYGLNYIFNCSGIAFFYVFLSSLFVIFYCLTFCSSCHFFNHSLLYHCYHLLLHFFLPCWFFLMFLIFCSSSLVFILWYNINVTYWFLCSAGHIPVSINIPFYVVLTGKCFYIPMFLYCTLVMAQNNFQKILISLLSSPFRLDSFILSSLFPYLLSHNLSF